MTYNSVVEFCGITTETPPKHAKDVHKTHKKD